MTGEPESRIAVNERREGARTVPIVRCGAELVDLAELYYVRIYAVTQGMLAGIVVLTLAMVPLGADRAASPFTLIALGAIGCGGALGIRRPHGSYRALRTHPAAIVAGVAGVAIALVIDDPLNSALWLVAFGVLSIAVIAGDGPLTTICACILILGYVLGVVVHGHLRHFVESPQLALEATGYAFWALLLHGTLDSAAASMLRINQCLSQRSEAPRPVAAWSTPAASSGVPGLDTPDVTPPPVSPVVIDPTTNLTARQQQIVVLLCDGLREDEIARALAISVRQVERHVCNANRRAGAKNTNHLIAMAVAARLAPSKAA